MSDDEDKIERKDKKKIDRMIKEEADKDLKPKMGGIGEFEAKNKRRKKEVK